MIAEYSTVYEMSHVAAPHHCGNAHHTFKISSLMHPVVPAGEFKHTNILSSCKK